MQSATHHEELLEPILGEPEPEPKQISEIDPRKPRYVFSPMLNKPIEDRTVGLLGIPAGRIVQIRTSRYRDQNWEAVKSADLAVITQHADKPEFIDKERTALAITRQIVLDFGGLVEDPTGFCELEALAGKDDPELIRDMQRLFLPRRFIRGDDQLQHLYILEPDVMEMDELYEQVWKRLIWSTETALQWGNNYRLSTIASMEAYANNRDGKPQPSKLDFAVCRWINQPVPKIASKVEQPDQKTVAQPQTVVVQAAAPQPAGDGLERKQCQQCGEMIALIKGEYPRICRFCGQRPAGDAISDAEGAEIVASIDRAVASGEQLVASEEHNERLVSPTNIQANKQRDGRGRFIAQENRS